MQYTNALIMAVASFAAAQSTTSSASTSSTSSITQSGCGGAIDAIITNCIASTTARVANCAPTDWDCLCATQQAVLTCYNNCPTDARRSSAEGTQSSYCNQASILASISSSTSMSSNMTISTGSLTASSTSTDASATESSTSTRGSKASSATDAAASATGSGSAGSLAVPAGGFLAAVFGLAAVLLRV